MGRDCVMGDLNGCVGDRIKVDITGAFGVSKGNGNGRELLTSVLNGGCEKVMCISSKINA